MKTFRKITALMLALIMTAGALPLTNAADTAKNTQQSLLMPAGYHFAGISNFDENGEKIFYIEDEASEYGLTHGMWIYSDGKEADDPDILPAYSEKESNANDKADCPASYDAREYGLITPVEYQTGGTCWAHSAISCMETAYIKQGLGSALDLSEYHTVWFGKNGYIKNVDASANDGYEYNDISNVLDEGGNMNDVSRAVMNFAGGALEERFPFTSENEADLLFDMSETFTYDTKYVSDIVVEKISSVEKDEVKQAVLDFGAVKASYCSETQYYTPSSYWYVEDTQPECFFCPESKATNHAVTIIGWDDNFSKENFNEMCRPGSNGAWLVKNSWSSDWGNYGYFWISYEDKTLSSFYTFTLADKSDFENVYMYDGMGYGSSMNVKAYANVFTAGADEYLTKISYGSSSTSDYTLKIYKNLPENYEKPTDGALAYTQSGNLAGEKYIDVEGNVTVSKGERFAVVIETPHMYYEGGDYATATKTKKYTSNLKESYYLTNQSEWKDASAEGLNNTCIRAVTKAVTEEGNFKVKFKDGVKYENTVISNGSVVTLPTLEGNTFVFTYNGKEFDGTGVNKDMTVNTHCYPTNGTPGVAAECVTEYKCIFCGKEMKPSDESHSYSSSEIAPSEKTIGYTKHTCRVCGNVYYDNFKVYGSAVGSEYDTLHWQYCNGKLSVVATGEFPDFSGADSTPWKNYKTAVKELYVVGAEKIGKYAFSGLSKLEKVYIPDLVQKIEANAFAGDGALTSFTCPTELKEISSYAFKECRLLSTFRFNSKLETISGYAFENCDSLIDVTVPGCVTSLGNYIFNDCDSLKKVTLGEGITYVPSVTWECPLLEEVVFPSTFTGGFFANYSHVVKFTVSQDNADFVSVDGVIYSKDMTRLVAYPSFKTGVYYDIPDSVTRVDSYAFSHTNFLTYLDMSCNAGVLNSHTFNQTVSLKNINLPSSLAQINENAFSTLHGFEGIFIPSSVTQIAESAFTYFSAQKYKIYTDADSSAAKTYADSESIPCEVLHVGHTYSKLAYGKEPTCQSGSETIRVCTCGEFLFANEAKKDHSFTGEFVDNGNNTHSHKCLYCELTGGDPVSCSFSLTSSKPGANCLTTGFDTYSCVCGASYQVPNDVTGNHKFKGDTCLTCGYVRENYQCTCQCHSTSGLVKLIWSIKVFFWRLFGKTANRECDCGIMHW